MQWRGAFLLIRFCSKRQYPPDTVIKADEFRVHRKACIFKALLQSHIVGAVAGARTGTAIDGIAGPGTEQVHCGAIAERKRIVFVFKQYDAFGFDLLCHFGRCFACIIYFFSAGAGVEVAVDRVIIFRHKNTQQDIHYQQKGCDDTHNHQCRAAGLFELFHRGFLHRVFLLELMSAFSTSSGAHAFFARILYKIFAALR